MFHFWHCSLGRQVLTTGFARCCVVNRYIRKIFEKIINSRLRHHLEENNLYNTQQYGFRQGKSTTHVTNMIHECVKHNSAQGFKTAILSKDVQKAFDTVWHSGLIWKIHNRFNLPMPIKK
ncbi:unnamed protein product, partial [Meganyctiphanes norvegica]